MRHKFDNFAKYLGAVVLFGSVQGCAFFNGKADPPPLPPGIAATTLPIPLPVEVAKDIAVIAKGGSVELINPPLASATVTPNAAAVVPAAVRTPDSQQPSAGANAAATPSAAGCNCDMDSHHSAPKKRKTASLGKIKPRAKGKILGDKEYVVKRDDTLMKISFEKFGNVYRWREIYNENKDRIPDYNQLVEGTVLKIKGVEYVVIERNGLPYLIRRDDTLVKISRGLYGTPKRWRHLWDNNRQLIHDPNKIYAGFTLYYQPDGVTKPAAAKLNLQGPLRSRIPANKK